MNKSALGCLLFQRDAGRDLPFPPFESREVVHDDRRGE